MKAFNELKSAGTESNLSLDSGRLDYRTKTKHDTIYVPGKDSIIYRSYPVPGKTVYIQKPLTWWQQTWIRTGYCFVIFLLLRYFPAILKGVIKLLKRYLNGK